MNKINTNEKKIAVILSILNTMVSAIVSIIYIPLLLSTIGKNEYGLYQLIGSIIAYFSTMYSSINASVMKYYTEYLIIEDYEKMENTLAISKRIFIYISIFIVIIAIPISIAFKSSFSAKLTDYEINESMFMFKIMIINILVYLNSSIYSASILAHEKFIFRKTLDLAVTILQPISVLCLIKGYPRASTIVIIQLILNIISLIICMYYSKNRLQVKVKYHYKDKNLIKGIFSLSSSVLLISIADQIFWKTDQIILGSMYGTGIVAEYAIGSQFNSLFISAGVVIISVIVPMITRINQSENSSEKLSNSFSKIGRYQAYLVLLMLTGVILYGKEFIMIIAGADFLSAYSVALLLMIPYSVDLIQSSGNVILLVKNKNWYKAVILFTASIINVGLTYYLAKQYGMYGAAFATTISIVMASWFMMNIVYYKVIKLDIVLFWKEILPIIIFSFISLGFGLIIKKITVINIYIQFIIHGFLYVIVYIMIMYIFAMNVDEKSIIHETINKIKN